MPDWIADHGTTHTPELPGVAQTTGSFPRVGDNSVDDVDNTGTGASDHPESPPGSEGDRDTGDTDRSGRDLAHDALATAREKARARGAEPGVRNRRARGSQGSRRRWAGPGPDRRDPQPLGRVASQLADERGWQSRLNGGVVFGRWCELVGEEVAEHAQPVALHEGELTVRASSTAWATQLRLLQSKLIARIAAGVGNGVVKRMRIQGPTAPSWRKGPLHVPGRGPRDTYG